MYYLAVVHFTFKMFHDTPINGWMSVSIHSSAFICSMRSLWLNCWWIVWDSINAIHVLSDCLEICFFRAADPIGINAGLNGLRAEASRVQLEVEKARHLPWLDITIIDKHFPKCCNTEWLLSRGGYVGHVCAASSNFILSYWIGCAAHRGFR